MTVKAFLTAIALGASTVAGTVAQANGVATAAQDNPRYVKAMAFLKLMNSPEQVSAQIRQGYAEGIQSSLASDPTMQALEKSYPGITAEFAEATIPYLIRLVNAKLPILWDRQATYLASTLTEPELDDLIAYYTSPAGKRLIAALLKSFQGNHMAAEIEQNGMTMVSPDSMRRDVQAATPTIMNGMTDEDRTALVAFGHTAGGRKLNAISGPLMQITASWVTEVLFTDTGFKEECEKQAALVLERRQRAGK